MRILLFTSTFVILGFLNFMAGVGDSHLLLQKDQIINASSIVEFRDFAEGTFFISFWYVSMKIPKNQNNCFGIYLSVRCQSC